MKKKNKKLLVIALTASLLAIIAVFSFIYDHNYNCFEERVSFDFGTGSIKGKVAVVDKCKGIIATSKEFKENSNLMVPCMEINEEGQKLIKESCFETTKMRFIELENTLNISCRKQKCRSIATAWARNSMNSEELITQINGLGANLRKVSQEEEGQIAFKSVMANLDGKVDAKDVIVFDIGGGSFQLSTMDDNGNIHVFKGDNGVESFDKLIRDKYNFPHTSSNPYFGSSELEMVVNDTIERYASQIKNDAVISAKLKSPNVKVYGIGGPIQRALLKQMYTTEIITPDVLKVLAESFIGKHPSEMLEKYYPDLPENFIIAVQVSCLMIKGIMHSMEINEFEISPALNNDYILVHEFD